MSSEVDDMDPREMIFDMMRRHRIDARDAVSKRIGTTLYYLNNWLDGTYPEPVNRQRIKAAHQRYVEEGIPVIKPNTIEDGAIPATGDLEGAELLTIDRFVDKDDNSWGICTRHFKEQVFFGRTIVDILRKVGAGAGSRFYGKVGPSVRADRGYDYELKAIDIAQ